MIDTGLARIVRYDAERGIDRWELARISRAAADQRAGRAGRTGPGRCIRLWSEREHRGLPDFEQPEIHRVDLCATVLALHAWGTADPARFAWYDPPAPERLAAAERLLVMLGGLAGTPPRITPAGHEMLALPVHPRLARLLVAARQDGRVREGAAVAALLSERDIRRSRRCDEPRMPTRLDSPRRAVCPTSSTASTCWPRPRRCGLLLRCGRAASIPAAARQVALLRDELLGRDRHRQTKQVHERMTEHDDEAVLRWLLLAYPDRVVKRRGAERTGVMVGGRGVRLGPESVVRDAELYLALDAREDRRAGPLEVQVRLASTIELEWLEELFPGDVRRERLTRYDESRRRVIGANSALVPRPAASRGPVGGRRPARSRARSWPRPSGPEAAGLLRGQPQAALWLARLDFVRQALPELGWTEFNDEVLAELSTSICQGRTSLDEVEQTDFVPFLQSRLAPD